MYPIEKKRAVGMLVDLREPLLIAMRNKLMSEEGGLK